MNEQLKLMDIIKKENIELKKSNIKILEQQEKLKNKLNFNDR